MANIVDNVKQFNQLKLTVAEQMGRAARQLAAFDRVATSTLGTVQFAVTGSSPTQLNLRITTMQDDSLEFHYDPSINEFLIDRTMILLSFKATSALLEELETFVRRVLATVE